jgi:hypothetical protein
MSGSERSDLAAFKELEGLVRNLGEELAVFRRRAIAAEAQLKGEGRGARAEVRASAPQGRNDDLGAENEQLRARLGRTEDRVRQMMERVRFLRQQLAQGAPAGASRP